MYIIVFKEIFLGDYIGIALYPFIFLKSQDFKKNKTLINHEKIHISQQLEMLVIFFYIWYVVEYFLRLIQYKDKYIAYRNISFEREAYENELNLSYLKNRRFYSFLEYL